MASEKDMVTLYIDCRHINDANTLTIYVGDVNKGTVEGGRIRAVKVEPGVYTLKFGVYNDATDFSKSAVF